MTNPNPRAPLFADFAAVSKDDWEKKIEKDLKGEAAESLYTQTYEGIRIRPFYTAADLDGAAGYEDQPETFPYLLPARPGRNSWQNLAVVLVAEDSRSAIDKAVRALAAGADGVQFKLSKSTGFDFEYLVSRIDLTATPVSYALPGGAGAFLDNLFQALEHRDIPPQTLKGFIQIYRHQIAEISKASGTDLAEIMAKTADLPEFYGITAHGAQFGNRGGTAVQELAFTLSLAVSYADRLSNQGLALETIFRNMQITVSTGTHYFMEIAKLRALRWLWSAVVEAMGADPALAAALRIHAAASSWYMTTFDPHTNILRNTTAAMSAIQGGCDSVSLLPFDLTFREHNAFSERVTRNIPLLLKHEAYLDQVTDPAAGSYYVESLTRELAALAWAAFQEMEGMGGFDGAMRSGFVLNQLIATAQVKFQAIASGTEVLVGTNKFGNRHEKLDYDGEALLQSPHFDTSRASYPFEVMRLAALLHFQRKQARPKAIIAIVGHDIQEHIHAAFAKEFFECGDFETEIMRFDNVAGALEKLLFTDCKIIVLSSPESDYERFSNHFLTALRNHKGRPDLILAAAPEEMKNSLESNGFDGYLFQNCDVSQIITRIHERLLTV